MAGSWARDTASVRSAGRPRKSPVTPGREERKVVSVVFVDLAGSTEKAEQLDPEGREALRDAGGRAAALYAIEAAERFYDAALRLWPADDPKRAVLLFRRAAPVRHIGGGDPERLMEACDALLKAGRPDEAGEVEMLLSRSFWIRGEHELSEAHTDRRQLAGVGASRRDSPGSGSAARAIADAERALEVVAAISDPQARYFTNALCAHVFVAARREQAAQLTREVIDDLLQTIPPSFAVIALPALASTALRLGLLPELIAALEKHMPTPWREVVRRYAAATTSPPPTCSARSARNPARPRPASTPRGSSRPPAVTTKPASNCSRPSPSTAPSVRRATWTRSSRF